MKIKALFTDVDGVLTNGMIWMSAEGETRRLFSIYDGQGLKSLLKEGFVLAFLTGSKGADIELRGRQLGVHEVIQGLDDKLESFHFLLKKHQLLETEVAYIGDDIADIPILKKVGFAATVPNAIEEVKNIPGIFISSRPGGDGAVREICDHLKSLITN